MNAARENKGNIPRQTTLITAATEEAAYRRALSVAADALCTAGGEKACGVCRACRKVSQGIHPDLITLSRNTDSKGSLKKEITVDLVRDLTREAYILPNEADFKVFIIRESDLMNRAAQNAALKLLEEPPNGALFMLCATAPDRLLPTVRSRCATVTLNGEAAETGSAASALADEYIGFAVEKNEVGLILWCHRNESMDGAAFQDFIESTREKLTDMMTGQADSRGMSTARLMRLEKLMEKCLEARKVNGNIKLLLGMLMASTITP